MRFVFSGKNENVCQQVYRLIADDEDCFFYYEDALLMLKDLCFGQVLCDILILDSVLYRGFIDFVYDVLVSKNLKIPIVTFGDPQSDETTRVQWWLSENEIHYDSYDMQCFVPVFRAINNALSQILKSSADKNDSVVSLDEEKKTPPRRRESVMMAVRNERLISPVSYNLLAFLYKHRHREISVGEIAEYLSINACCEKDRNNVVYAYISRLKKLLAQSPVAQTYNLKVLRTRKGFYKLFLL